jgi:hypothetical protein
MKLLSSTFVLAASVLLLHSVSAEAASATSRVSLRVLKSLMIQSISDLEFDPVYPGAAESVVLPESNGKSATFMIQGETNTSVTIQLPSEILLATGSGGESETIVIRDFKSSPAESGVIGADGSLTLYVGATRSAISDQQRDGLYTGTYTVDVIY